jgi:LPXTG-site transpeptidase (sortase) family protein
MCSVALFMRSMTKKSISTEIEIVPPALVSDAIQPAATVQAGVPIRLMIPGIQVNALIDSVGLTSDGTMDIKKNPDELAWYNLGPRPGDKGNAVIAGHYGWDNGKGSVFNDLHTLQTGDTFSVIDEKGTEHLFVVRNTQSYDPAADATLIFRSSDGKAHLNLITCEGVWNNATRTYSRRLVVFGDKK